MQKGGLYEVCSTRSTWRLSVCHSDLPGSLTTAKGNEVSCGHSQTTFEAPPRIRSCGYVAIPSAGACCLFSDRCSFPHSSRKQSSTADRERLIRTRPRLCSDQESHTKNNWVE